MPGDVAQTGSIKLLGLLNVNQLLSVMDVAYPRISDSSIEGDSLVVTASGKNDDVALGDAGGYIGNGKAVMVKNSDVTNVKKSLHRIMPVAISESCVPEVRRRQEMPQEIF